MTCKSVTLPACFPGTQQALTVCRFGQAGAAKKAYVQASMHADEIPAMLCAHHLRALLEEAQAQGRIVGEIILVPAANPIGLSQVLLDHHMGRHHLPSGRNFNRFWPDGTEAVMEQGDAFGPDPAANAMLARRLVKRHLEHLESHSGDEALKLLLMRLAHDADIVLDLHTDLDAQLHLYVDPDHWPGLSDLAGVLDAKVVMLARHSGGNAFEETIAAPYIAMREAGIPTILPVTVTVELRGQLDVDEELARQDALALFDFLVMRGLINGEAAAADFSGIAAPFEATDLVRAPAGGIVVYERALGDQVRAGDVLGHIVDPLTGTRTPACTMQDGWLFTRNLHRFVQAGDVIAKVQGRAPLPGRKKGALMTD